MYYLYIFMTYLARCLRFSFVIFRLLLQFEIGACHSHQVLRCFGAEMFCEHISQLPDLSVPAFRCMTHNYGSLARARLHDGTDGRQGPSGSPASPMRLIAKLVGPMCLFLIILDYALLY